MLLYIIYSQLILITGTCQKERDALSAKRIFLLEATIAILLVILTRIPIPGWTMERLQ